MPEREKRRQRREQHTREVEASQEALRKSIAVTERLVEESDKMLKRGRRQSEDDEEQPPPPGLAIRD
jgi:hypothetical protein